MTITFHGAAECVTGSKHLLSLDTGEQILLDCGMFQGMGRPTLDLNSNWSFDPKKINCLILSHAHIDHSGLIPLLVKRGFNGKIFCTPATLKLCKIMLMDCARIQEEDTRFVNKKHKKLRLPTKEPLYTQEDAQACMNLFEEAPYKKTVSISERIALTFYDAGHILGSASVFLSIKDKGEVKRILFSGDVGRYKNKIITPPDTMPQADILILESTYGNRSHFQAPSQKGHSQLLDWIEHICIKKKGRLVIPAFSLGRTQELLYELNQLEIQGLLPKINYYVDSPLSMHLTALITQFVKDLNSHVQASIRKDADKNPFSFQGLIYTESAEDSKALRYIKEPFVVISSSGMGDAGRVKHHISNYIENSNNGILMSGYSIPSSLCGKLLNMKKSVSIFGIMYQVNAQIGVLSGMSAHGDHEDIMRYTSSQDPLHLKRIFLVHGEEYGFDYLRNALQEKGYKKVSVPHLKESFVL